MTISRGVTKKKGPFTLDVQQRPGRQRRPPDRGPHSLKKPCASTKDRTLRKQKTKERRVVMSMMVSEEWYVFIGER